MEMEDTEYVKHLDEPARSRYREKITAHIGYDPYQLKKGDFSRDLADLPAVEAMESRLVWNNVATCDFIERFIKSVEFACLMYASMLLNICC